MRPLVIFGSSRSDGDTRTAVDLVLPGDAADHVNLLEKEIGYFDYERNKSDDDFLPLAEEMVKHDVVVFATPVYWYCMSAVLKTFFDRFTDLVTIEKKLGRALKDTRCYVISAGSATQAPPGFDYPFAATCSYMEMNYGGMFYYCSGSEAKDAAYYGNTAKAFRGEILGE